MAFLTFPEATSGRADLRVAPVTTPEAIRFGTLEQQVIALARRDGLGTLRRPGLVSRLLAVLFRSHNPRLADPRLEALRRIAVLSWRRGYSVAPHEVGAFLRAGFSADQYELLLDIVSVSFARRSVA